MIAVTVNQHPVDAPAVVERGSVLLPLRTVFTALGASVSYDASRRVVVARTASHALRLALDREPVRVIAGHAYVPLRYVAEALGASVAYDAHLQLVSVQTQAASVVAQTPAGDARVSNAYPTISASLGTASAAAGDVVLLLDGEDVTSLATFDGTTITFLPRKALVAGHHTVEFSGRTLAHDPFQSQWSFDTTVSAPSEDEAPPFHDSDYRFYANQGAFYRGDWMHFTLLAPPGGSARLQLCNTGYEYALRSGGYGGLYEADIPAPLGVFLAACQVRAIYTSWNGAQTLVPVPLAIGLYTMPTPRATVRPTPSPPPPAAPRRIAPMPRRAEPTPQPRSSSVP